MEPNETQNPTPDEVAAADELVDLGQELDDVPPFGQSPDLDELMAHLMQSLPPEVAEMMASLTGGVQRDEKAHDARMQLVTDRQRAAIAEADQEQRRSDEPEAEPLAWGMWKTECGCIHFALPDGRGGWAATLEEVEPEKLVEVVRLAIRSIGETGLMLMSTLVEAGETI